MASSSMTDDTSLVANPASTSVKIAPKDSPCQHIFGDPHAQTKVMIAMVGVTNDRLDYGDDDQEGDAYGEIDHQVYKASAAVSHRRRGEGMQPRNGSSWRAPLLLVPPGQQTRQYVDLLIEYVMVGRRASNPASAQGLLLLGPDVSVEIPCLPCY